MRNTNSLLAEALEVPSLNHHQHPTVSSSSSSSFDDEHDVNNNNNNRQHSRSSKHRLPSMVLCSADYEHCNDDDDDDDDDTNDEGILSPPTTTYSYMNHPLLLQHRTSERSSTTTTTSSTTTTNTTTNHHHHHQRQDSQQSSSNSFFPASSFTSFDTPRIDNVRGMRAFLTANYKNKGREGEGETEEGYFNGNGSNNILNNTKNNETTTTQSSTSMLSNASSSSSAIEDETLPRHSDFTVPMANHQHNQHAIKEPPMELQSSSSQKQLSQHHHSLNSKATATGPTNTTAATTTTSRKNGSFFVCKNKIDDATSSPLAGQRRSIMGSSVGKKYRCNGSDGRRIIHSSSSKNNKSHHQKNHYNRYVDYGTTNNNYDGSLLGPHETTNTPPDSPILFHQHMNDNDTSRTSLAESKNTNNYEDTTKTPNRQDDTVNSKAHNTREAIITLKNGQPTVVSPLTPAYSSSTPLHKGRDDDIHDKRSHHDTLSTCLTSDETGQSSFPPSKSIASSRMTPRVLPMSYQFQDTPDDYYSDENGRLITIDDFHIPTKKKHRGHNNNVSCFRPRHHGTDQQPQQYPAVHETIHAQSLLLGLAFMAVWLPNNVMAPNLTQMADFFTMNEVERDIYLGSYCALAVGVFSLPISGLIGFMADFYSRKHLFVACVVFGALSSAWTGWSQNYWSLFFARLCSGGCMSGSVPVAFSLLGDLFSIEERNAASSGLTAMMGLGILAGQVYAGIVGPLKGWQYPFFVSAVWQLITAIIITIWVAEPMRGGKEKVLQDIFKSGNKYDRQLTLEGFVHAMHKNTSNLILLWQGFLTSLPWGIVFVFLNDYLSQEKGFSVPEATFMVMLFGMGCAIGGIAGGYFGQIFMTRNRSYLPLYMAAATFLGIFPFIGLLNSDFPDHNGYKAKIYSIVGGLVASLPSVNVRPCILNVNPPETRGAALTAANLLVTLGRGMGPSCIVFMGTIFNASRQFSFNVTLAGFWTISAIQLLFLAKTLPRDQDAMEEELARYVAASAHGSVNGADEENIERGKDLKGDVGSMSPVDVETTNLLLPSTPSERSRQADGESILSIEDYMTSFDGTAARRSLQFVRMGIQELNNELTHRQHACRGCEMRNENEDDYMNTIDESLDADGTIHDENITDEEMQRRRDLWLRQQREQRQ